MNNRGVPRYLGVQHNMMRHVIVNRMPVAVSAPVPPVPQIPVRPTVPVYTYPSTYHPPTASSNAGDYKASGLSAAITISSSGSVCYSSAVSNRYRVSTVL